MEDNQGATLDACVYNCASVNIFGCEFLYFPIFSPIVMRAESAMTDQILTLREVAAYLKLAEKTAYKLAAAGKLPGFKVGGSWRFKREDIDRWIEEQKTENKSS